MEIKEILKYLAIIMAVFSFLFIARGFYVTKKLEDLDLKKSEYKEYTNTTFMIIIICPIIYYILWHI